MVVRRWLEAMWERSPWSQQNTALGARGPGGSATTSPPRTRSADSRARRRGSLARQPRQQQLAQFAERASALHGRERRAFPGIQRTKAGDTVFIAPESPAGACGGACGRWRRVRLERTPDFHAVPVDRMQPDARVEPDLQLRPLLRRQPEQFFPLGAGVVGRVEAVQQAPLEGSQFGDDRMGVERLGLLEIARKAGAKVAQRANPGWMGRDVAIAQLRPQFIAKVTAEDRMIIFERLPQSGGIGMRIDAESGLA